MNRPTRYELAAWIVLIVLAVGGLAASIPAAQDQCTSQERR
jgi:hypothetical protein